MPDKLEKRQLPEVEQRLVEGLRQALHDKGEIRLKIEDNAVVPDHDDIIIGYALLCKAFGNAELEFVDGILNQIVNAVSIGPKPDIMRINFALSVIKSLKPRDEIEAMLIVQMVAVHMASMTFARKLAHVENIPQQDSAERTLNKLTRTYAAQMEALRKNRTGGQQKMVVEHVTVNDGGQAIVGNVNAMRGCRNAQK